MRLALAQCNPLVGDLEGNGRCIADLAQRAAAAGADLLLTPELSLWGYPPRDLLLRPALLERQEQVLAGLVAGLPAGLGLLVGIAEPIPGAQVPRLYNAVALVEAGGWRVVGRKRLLPSYDVFEERRYFRPGDAAALLELQRDGRIWRLGLSICEDLWVEEALLGERLAGDDPIAALAGRCPDLLLNLSASPFGRGKAPLRRQLAARAAARLGCPVVYLNQVGGNDELVFDGASFVLDASGRPLLQLAFAAEQLAIWDAGAVAAAADPAAHPAASPPAAAGSTRPCAAAMSATPGAIRPGAGVASTSAGRPSPLARGPAASGPRTAADSAPEVIPAGLNAAVSDTAEPTTAEPDSAQSNSPEPIQAAATPEASNDPDATPPPVPLQGGVPPAATIGPESTNAPDPDDLEQLLRILVLGVADYARKCGFRSALLGLSGGIDSALVALIASAALGADRVRALRLPSPWSSAGSLDDAAALAQRLGLATATVPIAPLMAACDDALTPALGHCPAGLTAENLQSRLRGTLLMAVANQEGRLLLSTGNKSELAVGYCTLYGDMNGGLAVIGDLYKTTVFALCDWIDSPAAGPCRAALGLPPEGELIGAAIRGKPPSAELRPDQRDSDSLPDYAVLDPLLKGLIEGLASVEQLVAGGVDPALAARVQQLVQRAEFKRRQAAPVLKVSRRAFGGGWRMPIACA